MSKRFLAILLVIAAVFIGLVFVSQNDESSSGDKDVSASNHIQGEGTTGVTLVEYADFQCPACAYYFPLVKEIKAKYGDEIKFQFRNFPIIGSHPNAMAAHRAAEAAAEQGKFWEMHDLLYERQQIWQSSRTAAAEFRGYAQEIGLDMDRYDQDVSSSEVQAVINADMKEGNRLNVDSTPTFILDGQKIENPPQTLEEFSALIDQAIAKNQSDDSDDSDN